MDRAHPDWEFRIWRLEDLTWLRNQALFDRAKSYAQKADIARYEVIHRSGGVYLDTDMECLRSLDPLLEGCEFFSARDVGGTISIRIFGATPSHPIMREMIERLPASCFVHPLDDFSLATGPSLLDRTIRDGRWEERRGVRIYPSAYFYPYVGWEGWRRHEEFPRAYAVHHWDHSWKESARGGRRLPADLLPREGEPMLPSARALWREASSRGDADEAELAQARPSRVSIHESGHPTGDAGVLTHPAGSPGDPAKYS